jgi:hypothetical protein
LIDFLDVLARWVGLGGAGVGTGLVVFVVTCVSSLAVVTFFVVGIPVDYFSAGRRPPQEPTAQQHARAPERREARLCPRGRGGGDAA